MKTVDDLGAAAWPSGPRPVRPERAARRRHGSPTTVASGPALRRWPISPTAARASSSARTSVVRRARPTPQYSLATGRRRLGEVLGRDVAFATDTVGESATATVDGLARRSGRAAREPALQQGRDLQGRRRARRVRRPARRSCRVLRRRRVRRSASQARQRVRRPAAARRTPRAASCSPRSRCCTG